MWVYARTCVYACIYPHTYMDIKGNQPLSTLATDELGPLSIAWFNFYFFIWPILGVKLNSFNQFNSNYVFFFLINKVTVKLITYGRRVEHTQAHTVPSWHMTHDDLHGQSGRLTLRTWQRPQTSSRPGGLQGLRMHVPRATGRWGSVPRY